MPQWPSAVLAVLVSVTLGAAINWWIGRGKEQRERSKERREEGADEREEDAEALATQRAIAKDALERATLAYQRLDLAEAALATARSELDILRPLRQQRIEDVETIGELRRRNRALDNDIKRLLADRPSGQDIS